MITHYLIANCRNSILAIAMPHGAASYRQQTQRRHKQRPARERVHQTGVFFCFLPLTFIEDRSSSRRVFVESSFLVRGVPEFSSRFQTFRGQQFSTTTESLFHSQNRFWSSFKYQLVRHQRRSQPQPHLTYAQGGGRWGGERAAAAARQHLYRLRDAFAARVFERIRWFEFSLVNAY